MPWLVSSFVNCKTISKWIYPWRNRSCQSTPRWHPLWEGVYARCCRHRAFINIPPLAPERCLQGKVDVNGSLQLSIAPLLLPLWYIQAVAERDTTVLLSHLQKEYSATWRRAFVRKLPVSGIIHEDSIHERSGFQIILTDELQNCSIQLPGKERWHEPCHNQEPPGCQGFWKLFVVLFLPVGDGSLFSGFAGTGILVPLLALNWTVV